MNTLFEQAKTKRDHLESVVKHAESALKAIPGVSSGLMGLTPENVRLSTAYRVAKGDFNKAFAALRAFNGEFVNAFKGELANERKERRKTP